MGSSLRPIRTSGIKKFNLAFISFRSVSVTIHLGDQMERHFDDDLNKFNENLLRMASLAEAAINQSTEALRTQNIELAKSIIEKDKEIDDLELEVDEQAIDLLARYQPLARDLRFITTGMRINMELERMGDLAVNISKKVILISGKPLLKPLVDIPKLSEIARVMVNDVIQAFVDRDEELAKKVILSDTESDKLRDKIQDEILNEYIVKDGTCAPRAMPLILLTRHLERICDHACSIAEDVIYMVRAEVVKHHPENL